MGYKYLPKKVEWFRVPEYIEKLMEISFEKQKSYLVSTLPEGNLGDLAFVTDAVSPTYLGTLTGGGNAACPVFFDGTEWKSH